ncbi:MAG: GNAT family N-acetyltransferase [Actinomycetota bacterium]|nr:GNAT family N-acetyltransferase [Actinomycetota bacterium]
MARPVLRVRPATSDDLPALVAFGDELRDRLLPATEGSRARAAGASARNSLELRYADALADPDRHLVVVVDASPERPEQTLGMALFTVGPANALVDMPAVHMSHAVVPDRFRRRGAGRALVAAAAAFAEERGVDQLVVSVHPGSREANRFFARLGFVPLAVRRVAPVAAVRRRLATGEVRGDDHVVRLRRRPVRVRGTYGLPLGPAPDTAES